MTPREALNTSAFMMLALAIAGPWGIPIGYGIGEVINRALKKHSGPPSDGGTRLRRVGPPAPGARDLKIAGGAR
jgi:hypothetical protein